MEPAANLGTSYKDLPKDVSTPILASSKFEFSKLFILSLSKIV